MQPYTKLEKKDEVKIYNVKKNMLFNLNSESVSFIHLLVIKGHRRLCFRYDKKYLKKEIMNSKEIV